MHNLSDKRLEERLTTVGNSLLEPPSSRDELLNLLDQIEKLLAKVEQSPTKSMQAAISPVMKALVAEELLKHSDVDVKVGVASCISEITRITAPEAPYDDDKMKDIFQLIVSSFEDLSDISGRSYKKRATILETVAKVRSCVILLDLECDQMIIEMFNHFFEVIRPYHQEVIFISMEAIMTLLLEESEEVSPDLLGPILATLKKDNEEAIPIAKKLGERVIQNSIDKLRPYLIQAIKSLGSSIEEYSEAVASVCNENPLGVEQSNARILKGQQEDGHEEINLHTKNSTVVRSPKSMISNGINESGSEICTTTAESVCKSELEKLDADRPVISGDKLDHAEAQKTPENHDSPCEDVNINPTEVKCAEDKYPEEVKDSSVQPSPSRVCEDEAEDAASPIKESLPDVSDSETDSLEENKSSPKELLSDDNALPKASEEDNISEEKKQQSSVEKQDDEATDKHETLTSDGAPKNNGDSTSDSDASSLRQKLSNARKKIEGGSSSKKEIGKKGKRGRPRVGKGKSFVIEDHEKEITSSPSFLISTKDEGIEEGTPRTNNKRKQSSDAEIGSVDPKDPGENLVGSKIKVWWPKDRLFYEGVVGSFDAAKKKHKVLYTDGDEEVLNLRKERWELVLDDLASEGKQMSKLFYEQDQDAEHSSHHPSSDVQRKKRGGSNSEASKKRRKMEGSLKIESISTPTQSGSKYKDVNKAEPDSKQNKTMSSKNMLDDAVKSKNRPEKLVCKTQGESAKGTGRLKFDSAKGAGGAKDDSARGAGRAKDDSAKTSSHMKQDSDERVTKSEGKARKSGKTPVSTGKVTKSSTSNVKGTDRIKETANSENSSELGKRKTMETPKARENDSKSGKKRRK